MLNVQFPKLLTEIRTMLMFREAQEMDIDNRVSLLGGKRNLAS